MSQEVIIISSSSHGDCPGGHHYALTYWFYAKTTLGYTVASVEMSGMGISDRDEVEKIYIHRFGYLVS